MNVTVVTAAVPAAPIPFSASILLLNLLIIVSSQALSTTVFQIFFKNDRTSGFPLGGEEQNYDPRLGNISPLVITDKQKYI